METFQCFLFPSSLSHGLSFFLPFFLRSILSTSPLFIPSFYPPILSFSLFVLSFVSPTFRFVSFLLLCSLLYFSLYLSFSLFPSFLLCSFLSFSLIFYLYLQQYSFSDNSRKHNTNKTSRTGYSKYFNGIFSVRLAFILRFRFKEFTLI